VMHGNQGPAIQRKAFGAWGRNVTRFAKHGHIGSIMNRDSAGLSVVHPPAGNGPV
jgi:hypothetical protein